jgi:hypothetical protein
MRFKYDTPAYIELHARLDVARETYTNLPEDELTDKLEEVRDAYVREIRQKSKMPTH